MQQVSLDLVDKVDGLLVGVEEVTIMFKVLVPVLVVHGAAVHYCQEVHMLVVDLVVLLVPQREQMVSMEREVVVVVQRSLQQPEVVPMAVRVWL